MARPERNDVDYFPHPVNHKKKMFIIREKYGNDGYATWFTLLEILGANNYHYISLKECEDIEYVSLKCKVSKETLFAIIKDLVKYGEFDAELWEHETVLFNQGFVDKLKEVYKKRTNDCITKKGLREHLQGLRVGNEGLRVGNPQESAQKGPVNPQSKVKQSKVKKTTGPLAPAKPVHFKDKYPKFKDDLKQKCIKLDTLSKANGKTFDAFKFVQLCANKLIHPEAILEALTGLIKTWHSVKDPWPYAEAIIKTQNGNYNERDHRQEAAKFKDNFNKDPTLAALASTIGANIDGARPYADP